MPCSFIHAKQYLAQSPTVRITGFRVFSSRMPRLKYTVSHPMPFSFIYAENPGNQRDGEAAAAPLNTSVRQALHSANSPASEYPPIM